MSEQEYKRGDLIDVTIQGARVARADDDSLICEVYGENSASFVIGLSDERFTVTRRAVPVEWPPRAGDIWRDFVGSCWFVYKNPHDQNSLLAMPHRPTTAYMPQRPELALLKYAPLELLYRVPEGGVS